MVHVRHNRFNTDLRIDSTQTTFSRDHFWKMIRYILLIKQNLTL